MTETTLPDPLVPPEVDLRDFGFMPLEVLRLRDSDLAALATGDEFKAAVLLWCVAWHQVPAASLPDDDRLLAKHSQALAGWRKVKTEALRGFVKCVDGRLYHPVIAAKATEAWASKQAQRARTAAATAAREAKRRAEQTARDELRNVERHEQRHEQRDDERDVHQGIGTVKGQGQGQGQGLGSVPSGTGRPGGPPPEPVDVIFALAVPVLTAAGVADRNARSMLGMLRKQHGDAAVAAAVQRMATERPSEPVGWLQAALKGKKPNGHLTEDERRAENARTTAEAARLLGIDPPPQEATHA